MYSQKVQNTHIWLLFLLFKYSFKCFHPRPYTFMYLLVILAITWIQHGHNRHIWKKSFWKTSQTDPTSAPSLGSLSPSDSLLQAMIHSTAETVTGVPHLSFSETCWLVLSVTPAFWIHELAFHPAHDECLLLFHNGTFSQCGCAPCLCTLDTVNEMQSLYFSSKYFSYLCFPGSAIYLYYLLSSPCDPLQSTDKNWFLFCE